MAGIKDIKIGFVGMGGRGRNSLMKSSVLDQGEHVVAVCDVYPDRVEEGAKIVVEAGLPEPAKYTDYHDLLADENVNVVIISTSWEYHIPIAIDAMKAGKAVAMEVGGAYSLDDCRELVRTWEETRVPFMFLENCCFGRRELMAWNMAKKGVLGEIVHCEGEYTHDLRHEVTFGHENRHYRLDNYLKRNCENYPTHELGPIAKILDINHGNRFLTLTAMASKSVAMHEYVLEKRPNDEELKDAVFAQGDIVTTIIKCANGETIRLMLGTSLPHYYTRGFTVRGTKGMYEECTDSVYLDIPEHHRLEWNWRKNAMCNADEFAKEYEHPLWKTYLEEGVMGGHDGMDWLEFKTFFRDLREGNPMKIDVYDAACLMAVSVLTEQSIAMGGAVVPFPDYTCGRWMQKDNNRHDI